MKKFLHPGVNVFQNDNRDYVIHFDQPLVTIKDRTYNSTDAFLSDLYQTVFTTLSTLISESQELKGDTAKHTKPLPNTAAFYLVPVKGLDGQTRVVKQPFPPASFSNSTAKNKPQAKKAAKTKVAYKWEPQVPAQESIYTVKASGPNGLTPEEIKVNGVKSGRVSRNTGGVSNNLIGNEQVSLDNEMQSKIDGNKLAETAKSLVAEWIKTKVAYDENHPDKLAVVESPTISDCVTFITEVFNKAGQTSVFGTNRDYPQTTDMLKRMYFLTFGRAVPKDTTAKTKKEKAAEDAKELEEARKALRMDNPKNGDIMMWEGHVAMVTGLDTKRGTFRISQMGVHGPSTSKGYKDAAPIHYKNNEQMQKDISAYSGIPSIQFWGFWTLKNN